jgi:hypothetical protein
MKMDKASAGELVAARFSRMMNATTSSAGIASDPPVVAVVTAVFLVIYLAARQSGVSADVLQVLLALVGLPFVVAIVIVLALLGARRRVIGWLESLPFPLENMNAVLNGLGDGLELNFASSVPETPSLNSALDAVHPDCFVTDTKDQMVVIRIGVVDNKRVPPISNYRRYRRVIDLATRVLVPLHQKHPIETVRVC